MPYNATIFQVLLSSPSDLPDEHREVITTAMQKWNATNGQMSKIHFSATDWKTGVNPAYGNHPQQIINKAIVDSSDLAIVVFTGKLGTPTDDFQSGTVEEINKMFEAGKEVAIFVNRTPITVQGANQTRSKLELEEYLEEIQQKSFYREYSSLEDLTQSINSLLQSTAMSFSNKGQLENIGDGTQRNLFDSPSVGVWPSLKKERYQETDSRGRLGTKTRHLLVIENLTGVPVRNVRYQFLTPDGEPDELFDIVTRGEPRSAGSLAPNGQNEFTIMQSLASENSTTCKVFWETPNGEEFTTEFEIVI